MVDIVSIITGGGGIAVIGAIVAYFRYKKKDKAEVKKVEAEAVKTEAEANKIIVDGFKDLLRLYQEENKILKATVNELRINIIKLQEQVSKM